MAKKKFPNEVYVIVASAHGEETFLAVVDKLDEIDEEQPVAVYRLVETKQLKIARSLT